MLHGEGESVCGGKKAACLLENGWQGPLLSLQARKVDSSLLLMTDGTLNELLRKKRVQFSTQY